MLSACFQRQMASHDGPHMRHRKTQIKSGIVAIPGHDDRFDTALPNVLAMETQGVGDILQCLIGALSPCNMASIASGVAR